MIEQTVMLESKFENLNFSDIETMITIEKPSLWTYNLSSLSWTKDPSTQ